MSMECDREHYRKTKRFFKRAALKKGGIYSGDSGDGDVQYSFYQKRMMLIAYDLIRKCVVRNTKFESVLDVGCGNGDFLFGLHDEFVQPKRITGCDFTAEMVGLANKNRPASRINFVVTNVVALPLRDKCFDLTTCVNVLHHLKTTDLPKAISELARVTDKYLLLEIKDADNFFTRKYSIKTTFGIEFFPVSRRNVIKMLEGFGLVLSAKRGIFALDIISPRTAILFKRV